MKKVTILSTFDFSIINVKKNYQLLFGQNYCN